MDEHLSPTDNLVRAIATVNSILGLADGGFLEIKNLATRVDITQIWAVIASREKGQPFNKEIFFGNDSIGGTLVCTEVTPGHEYGVTPEKSHLIGAHTHLSRGCINPFYDARPVVAPSELASMLDTPIQYAELVFTRGKNRDYPCVLAIKTNEAAQVRYGHHEVFKQELVLSAILKHKPFWNQESHFITKCDSFAREKGIALYRGIIKPKSTRQQLLQLQLK